MLRTEEMEWKELLMKAEKEQLVDILVGKMVRDRYFYKEVYNEFVKEKNFRWDCYSRSSNSVIC